MLVEICLSKGPDQKKIDISVDNLTVTHLSVSHICHIVYIFTLPQRQPRTITVRNVLRTAASLPQRPSPLPPLPPRTPLALLRRCSGGPQRQTRSSRRRRWRALSLLDAGLLHEQRHLRGVAGHADAGAPRRRSGVAPRGGSIERDGVDGR